MNTINMSAIASVNQDRQSEVIDKAQAKIVYILREQTTIKGCEENIKAHQECLVKITEDVLTADMVLGRPASVAPSVNEVTILQAIKERNADKARGIEAKSKCHVEAVDSYRQTIAACNERIEQLRKEMNELTIDVVTPEQVLG